MTTPASTHASAEILCIGSELLLGDILNSNAQFLAKELAALGIPHHFQTVVGDNIERIHQVIALAQTRSSIVITTGGLGPTPDDLTHAAIASYFNTPLTERPEILEDIATKFAQRDYKMVVSNNRQALLPDGGEILPNPVGTAPGTIWTAAENFTVLTFPGVPSEMKRMWVETAVPYLRSQGWGTEVFHSKVLRHWGISESGLAEKLGGVFESQNPTVAPYAGKGEVRIRITGRAENVEAAQAIVDPVAQQVQAIAGIDQFGSDGDTLPSVVGELLVQLNQTVALAESCTGGWVGQQLTTVPGSSRYFIGSVGSYSNRVKQRLLGVEAEDLAQYGAVSELVAAQMARGVRELMGTDWGVSVTGIAGPDGGTEAKPVGLVYFGVAGPDGTVAVTEKTFGSYRGRDWVRWRATLTAVDLLRRAMLTRRNLDHGSTASTC